ncbi:MAG: hypothetical protein KF722_08690 [Nitrospira sp.]|nr:hypothetical protein [Nitrospira sp.]
MKIAVSKIAAAKSQLLEASNLFFEERDPVSIHTLTCAALQILHDHFEDIGQVWDHNLIFHYDLIYIKDEYRKQYFDKAREAANFFKHTDRDLKTGKTSIEFNTEENAFYIFEASRCLRIIEGSNYVFHPEFRAFVCWLGLKYPNWFKGNAIKLLFSGKDVSPDNYKYFRDAIGYLKANPSLMLDERRSE